MKRIASILKCALMFAAAVPLAAQQVRAGGGPGPAELTKDWPKIAGRPGMSAAGVAKALEAYLAEMAARDLFSGTVLLAHRGEVELVTSHGLANKDFAVPNARDTRFNIGSINKVFTQVALYQLRDEGKIDFDRTLRTYLPDYPSEVADRITIAQIMSHRSGLGDFFGPEYFNAPRDRIRTLRDYLPFFAGKPLEFEPGTRTRYSNAGYILLGLVIEKLSGMNYHDYVRTRIFEPAGMKDSGSFAVDEVVPRRASGYTRRGPEGELPERRVNVYALPARSSSAGGGYSTVDDLHRFVRALASGKLLKKESVARLAGAPPEAARGEGEMKLFAGWAGGGPGLNAVIEAEGDWLLIVMSNYDPPVAEEVARNWRSLVAPDE